MKIYIQKFCSGYYWFEADSNNVGQRIRLEFDSQGDYNSMLSKLKRFSQYHIAFLHEGNEYILSLNGLEDTMSDTFGRPLQVRLAFVDKNSDLLYRLLFEYLSDISVFSCLVNSIFKRGGQDLWGDFDKLHSVLEDLSKKLYTSYANEIINAKEGNLLFFSSEQPKTITENLGLKYEQVKVINKNLNDFTGEQYFVTLSDEKDQLKKELSDEQSGKPRSEHNEEIEELRKKLDGKEIEINNLKSKIATLSIQNVKLEKDRLRVDSLNQTVLKFKYWLVASAAIALFFLVLYILK